MGGVEEWAWRPGAEAEALALLRATLTAWRDAGVSVVELNVTAADPLRPLLADMSAEDRTTHGEVLVRVQHPRLFLETVRPLFEARATAAGRRLCLHLTDGGDSLIAGAGTDLELELESSDLCALLYNGRRLPGLVEEGGLDAAEGDFDILRRIFPDTSAARRHLDSY